jgi:hypothetical protein
MDQDTWLTIEEAEAAALAELRLPDSGCKVRVRRISSSEYTALLPVPPAIADDWPRIAGTGSQLHASREARRAAELAWLRGLPAEEQVRVQQEKQDVVYRTIAYAAVRPAMTAEQARLLGNDADWLFLEIMRASKLVGEAELQEASPGEAAGPSSDAAAPAP